MTKIAEKPQDARAIANYILDEAPKYGITDLSPLKLLKLIFLAHGWSFYLCDEPLVSEQPRAWQYGPVYPDVYDAVKKYGGSVICERIMNDQTQFPYEANLTESQKAAVSAILKRYGGKSAFWLSNLTHLPDTPWSEAMNNSGNYSEISADSMRNYYLKTAQEMGLPQ